MKLEMPEWNTFDTLYAINSFANSWMENEKLIQAAADIEEKKNAPSWFPQNDDEEGEYQMECRNARHLHDEILTPTIRYSSLVMLCTIVERELRRMVENLITEKGKPQLELNDIKGPSFLQQVNKFVGVFFELRLSDSKFFNSLSDLQKIRNCIVHCRGEVNLVKTSDREYLMALNNKRPGFYAFAGTDLKIEAECIEQFIREVWNFFTHIFQQLNWKLDDEWDKKQWNTISRIKT